MAENPASSTHASVVFAGTGDTGSMASSIHLHELHTHNTGRLLEELEEGIDAKNHGEGLKTQTRKVSLGGDAGLDAQARKASLGGAMFDGARSVSNLLKEKFEF